MMSFVDALRRMSRRGLLLVGLAPLLSPAQTDVSVSLDAHHTVVVYGLPEASLKNWEAGSPTREQWQSLVSVRLLSEERTLSPLRGRYRAVKGQLHFEPRFPLLAGRRYQVVVEPSVLEGVEVSRVEVRLLVPLEERDPSRVEAVYPSAETLPENLLKFYVHFSNPMSQGEAYRRLSLLDADGNEIAEPFLELGEELWDPGYRRFTLLIHPGRIKRGLEPRERLGPVLEQGKSYTLVVGSAWRDDRGDPLVKEYRKEFRVGPPDMISPNPARWAKTLPSGDSREPVVLELDESMDHALLSSMIWIEDHQGQEVEGRAEVDRLERRWRFLPRAPWAKGRYALRVHSEIEDLAGNSIRCLFDVDVFDTVTEKIVPKIESIGFVIQ